MKHPTRENTSSELWSIQYARYEAAESLFKTLGSWSRSLTDPLLREIENLNIARGETMLDAGCGDGYYLRSLSTIFARTVGIDFSKVALQIGRRKLPSNAYLVCIDVRKLPFATNTFDLVVSLGVVEQHPTWLCRERSPYD